ncbi:MAG: sigma 54-interacting transcriptional regulator [Planctomycetes bacterium]|nr:sigma 54-interacting transcriptional regulator [Planctomycetota bacterium]
MIEITIIQGPFAGRRFSLASPVSIGRSMSCGIVLSGEPVSRLHAEILREEDGYKLYDRSKNGLLLNGEATRESYLAEGDEIRIGDEILQIVSIPELEITSEQGIEIASRENEDTQVFEELDAKDFSLTDSQGISFVSLAVAESTQRRLLEIIDAVTSLLNLKEPAELFDRVVDTILALLKAERVSLFLKDDNSDSLRLTASKRVDNKNDPFVLSKKILVRSFQQARAILSAEPIRKGEKARSVMCVPLFAAERSVGVLYVDRIDPEFSEEDLVLLTAVTTPAAIAIDSRVELRRAWDENEVLKNRLRESVTIIGKSRGMEALLEGVAKVAQTDSTALIRGETGTGKELVARAIHEHSRRAGGPFIALNCAALTDTLLEAELFGFEKGSFTGAIKSKPGKFELADKGTLFLDEIGDVSAELQVKLLRVLQERCFDRIGGTKLVSVDVRVIAATHQDLEALVEEGRFREDLYYRLNVIPLYLPPLRERGTDVRLLLDHYFDVFALKMGKPRKMLSDDALSALLSYGWRGNVRELCNFVERLMVLHQDKIVELMDLPEYMRRDFDPDSVTTTQDFVPEGASYREILMKTEEDCIRKALAETGGKKVEAAKLLGMSRPTLDKKIAEFGIEWK